MTSEEVIERVVAFFEGELEGEALAEASALSKEMDAADRFVAYQRAVAQQRAREREAAASASAQQHEARGHAIEELREHWAEWAADLAENLADTSLPTAVHERCLRDLSKVKIALPPSATVAAIAARANQRRKRNFEQPVDWAVSRAFSSRNGICLYGTAGYGAWLKLGMDDPMLADTAFADYLLMHDIDAATRQDPVRFDKGNRPVVEFSYSEAKRQFLVTAIVQDMEREI